MLKMAGENAEQVANMIEECGGLDKIESLQSHEKVEIYKMAYDIIELYFGDEVRNCTFFIAICDKSITVQCLAGRSLIEIRKLIGLILSPRLASYPFNTSV